jgi:hypothetical protein
VHAVSVTGRLATDGVIELFQISLAFTQPPDDPDDDYSE